MSPYLVWMPMRVLRLFALYIVVTGVPAQTCSGDECGAQKLKASTSGNVLIQTKRVVGLNQAKHAFLMKERNIQQATCLQACATNKKSWATKCAWKNCKGCSDCTTCPQSCAKNKKSWTTKCKWKMCKKCGDCSNSTCPQSCAKNKKSWTKKCMWTMCRGCSDCSTNENLTPAPVPTEVAGLRAEYFDFQQGAHLPTFSDRSPDVTRTDMTIDYPNGGFFDGSNKRFQDHFAVRWSGDIIIEEPGDYTFYIRSDDGSRLTVEGKTTVDNDGLHAMQERSGMVALGRGEHDIVLEFFENAGGEGMQFHYSGPDTGNAKIIVPSSVLMHTPPAPTPVPPPTPSPTVPDTCDPTVVDTENWENGHGHGCESYGRQYCSNFEIAYRQEWTSGSTYNFPEENCVVCGKGCTAPTCQPGSFTDSELPGGTLTVASVCLDANIAGETEVFWAGSLRGPSTMHSVADPKNDGTIYFSWTEDQEFGEQDGKAKNGAVHVSKVRVKKNEGATLVATTTFNGFGRAGGIDITEDGIVGTVCQKYVPEWVTDYERECGHGHSAPFGRAPLMVAVCEVDSSTMTQHGQPWRIGKHWNTAESCTAGVWGIYPVGSNLGGWLTYAPSRRTWTIWYAGLVCGHDGYAMHTYARDAPKDDTVFDFPVTGVENRVEDLSIVAGSYHGRCGTGDHQSGAATRYHPLLGDIGIQKHNHGQVYMQQYGLAPMGGRFSPGHRDGRVGLQYLDMEAQHEGSFRACGADWIVALISDKGHVCTKVSKHGEILKWRVIEASATAEGYPVEHNFFRLTRLATLGSKESEARCGSEARFLMGYEKKEVEGQWQFYQDSTRWLVEVDGDCVPQTTPADVTNIAAWPVNQEWTTTREGAVTWVTAWTVKKNGVPNFLTYGSRKENDKMYGLTPNAHNAARVVTYWPKWKAPAAASTTTTTTPRCEIFLYEHSAPGLHHHTGAIDYHAGVGVFPMPDKMRTLPSSVKVAGKGCAACGYTSVDCSGSAGGIIFWNTSFTDRNGRKLPLGIVGPAYGLAEYWGCNDCHQCVEIVVDGQICTGLAKS